MCPCLLRDALAAAHPLPPAVGGGGGDSREAKAHGGDLSVSSPVKVVVFVVFMSVMLVLMFFFYKWLGEHRVILTIRLLRRAFCQLEPMAKLRLCVSFCSVRDHRGVLPGLCLGSVQLSERTDKEAGVDGQQVCGAPWPVCTYRK